MPINDDLEKYHLESFNGISSLYVLEFRSLVLSEQIFENNIQSRNKTHQNRLLPWSVN